LSKGLPHPELFMVMMEGLRFPRQRFGPIDLIPEAAAYRAWIDQVTTRRPWIEGAAAVTIFIEGSREDRQRVMRTEPEPPSTSSARSARTSWSAPTAPTRGSSI